MDELRKKLEALKEEIRQLAESTEALTDEQDARFDEATKEFDETRTQLEKEEARAKKIAEIRDYATANPTSVESGDGATGPTLITRNNNDPYDLSELRYGMPAEQRGQELRSRAHTAIEQAPSYVTDEHRQSAAVLVDRDSSGDKAAYMLEHGSPEYTREFVHYLRTGENRAAMSTTSANGGYLIPFFLDPTIILTNVGIANPIRNMARVESITTQTWHGISSAGVTAEWISEASEVTDASPTFLQPTITPSKADAYVQASMELIQDSDIASQLAMLFADARDRLEGAAFATGSGSGQPYGIVTELNLVTTSRVAATTTTQFGAIDVYAVVNNLPARHQNNCQWLAHWGLYNFARQFAAGAGAQSNFWVDLGPGIPSQLLGRSTNISSSMSYAVSTTGSNVLILGDFQQYLVVDRIGMEVTFNPIVLGANRRPTGESGWVAFWRTGARVTNADAFRMLRT